MAFSALDRAKLFAIFGVPKDTEFALIITTLAHAPITQISLYFPTWTMQDLTSIVQRMDTCIADCSAESQLLVEEQIAEWDGIATSPMKISDADNGVKGVVIDHAQQRKNIRMYIANILGISCPEDGWMGELKRMGFARAPYPYVGAGSGDR